MNNVVENLFSVKNKVIAITGASAGLGCHFAKMLAQAGAKVAMGARRLDKLKTIAEEIKAQNGTALPVKLDVTDTASIENFVTTVENQLGPIDVLINNAGTKIRKNFLTAEKTDWQETFDLNLIGVLQMSQAICKHFLQHKKMGSIINISSSQDILSIKNSEVAYHVTKAGVSQLTRSLALDMAAHGIRVNTLASGFFPATELNQKFFFNTEEGKALLPSIVASIPMLRAGEFDDLNGAILFLASDASRYVTGAKIRVDGGQAINKL